MTILESRARPGGIHDARGAGPTRTGCDAPTSRPIRLQINPDKLTIVPTSSRRVSPDQHAARAAWPRAWRTLESGPQDGVHNMASDLALLELADRAGTAVLRTYEWTCPTVSFGRNEPVRQAWDVAGMQAAGLDVVRRPTGGRALLHAHEVTYSVVMPLRRETPWRRAYDAVNARLLGALRALGVPASLCSDAETPTVPPDGPACFAAPAAGEVSVHGRKLVGSAVWRTPNAYLQHGAILLRDTQHRLAAFRLTRQEPAPQSTGLEAWMARPDDTLAARVIAALHDAWQAPADATEGRAVFHATAAYADAVRRHAATLGDGAWLWRR